MLEVGWPRRVLGWPDVWILEFGLTAAEVISLRLKFEDTQMMQDSHSRPKSTLLVKEMMTDDQAISIVTLYDMLRSAKGAKNEWIKAQRLPFGLSFARRDSSHELTYPMSKSRTFRTGTAMFGGRQKRRFLPQELPADATQCKRR